MRTMKIAMVLLPDVPLLAVAAAVETLRAANQGDEAIEFNWSLYSTHGQAVTTDDGLELAAQSLPDRASDFDWVILLGGQRCNPHWIRPLQRWLQQTRSDAVILSSGAAAEACRQTNARGLGVSTLHPKPLQCRANATAVAAVLHTLLQRQQGIDIKRPELETVEPLPAQISPVVREVVELMRANLEEPIELSELAHYVGLSRRQLERQFNRYLGCSPLRYYLQLRLERAKRLLLHTDMCIGDIAARCGFVSASHFSRRYRDQFELSPRQERTLRDQRHHRPLMAARPAQSNDWGAVVLDVAAA